MVCKEKRLIFESLFMINLLISNVKHEFPIEINGKFQGVSGVVSMMIILYSNNNSSLVI